MAKTDVTIWPSGEVNDVLIFADDITVSFTNVFANFSWTFTASDTGLSHEGLPIGIYSFDDLTWYDMLDGSGPVSIQEVSNTDGSVKVSWTVPSGLIPGFASGATVPMHMKVGIISLNNNEVLPAPIGGSAVLSYGGNVIYDRQLLQGELAKPQSGTVSVAHNSGHIPVCRVYARSVAGGAIAVFNAGGALGDRVRLDATNLTFAGVSGDTGTWIYRIYKDTL